MVLSASDHIDSIWVVLVSVKEYERREVYKRQLWAVVIRCEAEEIQGEGMAERPVLVGLIPQAVVLDPGDQVSWISDAGNLKVEFDANRCPFGSNIFQAPAGMRLLSGPVTTGTKVGSYKYKLWLNEQMVGRGEVIVR
jgi:hypothetical protein